MKPNTLLLFLFFSIGEIASQETPFISITSGTESDEMRDLMAFQKIDYESVKIKGAGLAGKNYKITLKEFSNGKLVKSETIFDSSRDNFFRIKSDSLKFKVLTQVDATNHFNLMLNFGRFSISERYLVPPHPPSDYVLKNFLGGKDNMPIQLDADNYIFAYMTPFLHGDGSASYCEVAQSGVNPEKLFDKFKIPHYYLLEMSFQ